MANRIQTPSNRQQLTSNLFNLIYLRDMEKLNVYFLLRRGRGAVEKRWQPIRDRLL